MNRHLEKAAITGMLFVLAAGACPAQDAKKNPADKQDAPPPNYYPLQAGNEWHLRLTANDKTLTAITRVTKIESIDGVELARVEAVFDGKVAATEHLRQTAQGVFRYRYNGAESIPPFPVLKYPVKAGERWQGDFKVGTEKGKYRCEANLEMIEVPAGKFKTVRVDTQMESDGKTIQIVNWLAQDVGIVKQTLDLGPVTVILELEKYELKKARRDKK